MAAGSLEGLKRTWRGFDDDGALLEELGSVTERNMAARNSGAATIRKIGMGSGLGRFLAFLLRIRVLRMAVRLLTSMGCPGFGVLGFRVRWPRWWRRLRRSGRGFGSTRQRFSNPRLRFYPWLGVGIRRVPTTGFSPIAVLRRLGRVVWWRIGCPRFRGTRRLIRIRHGALCTGRGQFARCCGRGRPRYRTLSGDRRSGL